MVTSEFFEAVLPSEGPYCLVVFKPGQAKPAHIPATTLEQLTKTATQADGRGWEVYFACAAGTPSSTKRANKDSADWHAQTLWMDLDCGEGKPYQTKREAAEALQAFVKHLGLPFPMLVDSGNGLHAYWRLESPVSYAQWSPMAQMLKAKAIEFGLGFDRAITADEARILRPVGCTNRKKTPKQVRLSKASNRLAVSQLQDILQVQCDSVEIPDDLNDDLTCHLPTYPDLPKSAHEIAKRCKQVAMMRDTQGDLNYDHWFGVIGIIKHCVEGLPLAIEWSARRAETGHSRNDAEDKFNSWGAGPTTCESFAQRNPGGCTGCPHKDIRSPIQLGFMQPERKEEVAHVEIDGKPTQVQIPPLPQGYMWEKGHLWRVLTDKEGKNIPVMFTKALFYPIYRVHREETFGLGIRMHLPDGRAREFEIDTGLLAAPGKLLEELGHKGEIVQTNNKDAAGHLTAYMRDSFEELKRQAEEMHTMVRYGWSESMDSFLLGNRLYRTDGEVCRVVIGGAAADYFKDFPDPRGSIERYADALNFIYNHAGYEHLQYIICSGFSSVLTPLGENLFHGLLLAVSSLDSGKGKTTACHAAMYAFGDATKMTISGKSGATINALMQRMGVYGSLPVLFDEFTNLEPKEISDLAYKIANGMDKDRLEASGKGVRKAKQFTWDLSPFMTGNVNFLAMLSAHMANSQAEGVRIVQIRTDEQPQIKFAPGEVDIAISAMRDNRGCAGDAFLRYVLTHKDEIRAQVRTVLKDVMEHLPSPEYRFFRNQVATALVSAKILGELKIAAFDYQRLFDYSMRLMGTLRQTVQEEHVVTHEDAFSMMVNDLTPRILHTLEYRDGRDARGAEPVAKRNHLTVAGRFIYGSAKEPLNGMLYIAKKEIKEWCVKQRVDVSSLMTFAKTNGFLVSDGERFNLTRGTELPAVQIVCASFDMNRAAGVVSPPKLVVHKSDPALANSKQLAV